MESVKKAAFVLMVSVQLELQPQQQLQQLHPLLLLPQPQQVGEL